MKKIVSLILACAALSALLLCGCGSKTETETKTMDPAALVQDVLQNATFTADLNEIDSAVAIGMYNVDANDVADVIYYGANGATADEVTVFTAVDEDAAGRIYQAAQSRIASRLDSFRDYNPTSAAMLENAVVIQDGVYVVIAVSADSSADPIVDRYLG